MSNSILPQEHRQLPFAVSVALWLFGTSSVISLARIALVDFPNREARVSFWTVLFLLWFYGLWRRQGWVWYLTVIGGAYTCVTPFLQPIPPDRVPYFVFWVQYALWVSMTTILVLPTGRNWFLRRTAA